MRLHSDFSEKESNTCRFLCRVSRNRSHETDSQIFPKNFRPSISRLARNRRFGRSASSLVSSRECRSEIARFLLGTFSSPCSLLTPYRQRISLGLRALVGEKRMGREYISLVRAPCFLCFCLLHSFFVDRSRKGACCESKEYRMATQLLGFSRYHTFSYLVFVSQRILFSRLLPAYLEKKVRNMGASCSCFVNTRCGIF